MTALVYNIVIYKGADFSLTVRWKDKGTGAPISLAGRSVLLQVRKRPGQELIAEFSTEDGRITTDDDDGEMTIAAAGGYTDLLTPGDYSYNLEVSVDGTDPIHRDRLMEGDCEIRERINSETT